MTVEEFIAEFGVLTDGCERVMPGSTDASVQLEQVEALDAYIKHIKGYKRGAIAQNHSDVADLLFHFQCLAQALKSYLQVWMSFKVGKHQTAWRHLIDAVEYNGVSAKAYDQPGNAALSRRLEGLEQALFPSFATYFSPGFTETIGNCSICRESFTKCDHLENHIYCGRLCQRINRKIIEVDHSSLVDSPRDRRCIIPEVENDTLQMVSRFTQLVTGPASDVDRDDKPGRRAKGILMSFGGLDFD